MSQVLDGLRRFVAWWQEGLTKIGTQFLQADDWPGAPLEIAAADEADREAWEEERARLALSPWWM